MKVFFWHIYSLIQNINSIVWGTPMLILIIFCGIYFTCGTRFFQIFKVKLIWRHTVRSLFCKKGDKKDGEITQFQAFATALAGTIGTGNIAGVATALVAGGAGAVFWMWVSAFFGMMTGFAEKTLGIYYRKKNDKGEWCGGAMYYIEEGLKRKKFFKHIAKPLAVIFALFCLLASFGIGNMTQVNSMAGAMEGVLEPFFGIRVSPYITGAVVASLAAVVLFGGVQRIAGTCERLVPFMAVIYMTGAIYILISNFSAIPAVFSQIFKNAFGIRAIGGGISGTLVKHAAEWGLKRGVFSNEAGLGSSVMAHSMSSVKEPCEQGMWGIFEVFFDTVIVCTLTAFAVLSSGVIDANGNPVDGLNSVPLVSRAFSLTIGEWAGVFISLSILFFAFATIVGWSFYGSKCAEYLFGNRASNVYKMIFIIAIVFGATMKLEVVWNIADTLNGLMAIPNLTALFLLSGDLFKITDNYLFRQKNPKAQISPMLSAYKEKKS